MGEGRRVRMSEDVQNDSRDAEVPLLPSVDGLGEARLQNPILDILKKFTRSNERGADAESETPAVGEIFQITRTANYWFDREIGVLERDARAVAADWAAKGLPRHGVQRHAPLEVEQFLAGRYVEILDFERDCGRRPRCASRSRVRLARWREGLSTSCAG